MRYLPEKVARRRPLLLGVALIIALTTAAGCKEEALKRAATKPDGSNAGSLTSSQGALVLAKVGDKSITLGEFAATLERMDQFDRLKYQTPERRRELLDAMVSVELLAREAEQRGLQNQPETKAALRQIMRDAVLAESRKDIKPPVEIPEAEVRAYYESHKDQFQEPERRRISHLVVKDKETAEKLLAEAKGTSAMAFGKLVREHSLEAKDQPQQGPVETAGDLGLVGPPGEARGSNPRVTDEVRAAAFEIGNIGDVLDRPLQDASGKWHIVRLTGKTDAHARSFAESERAIRIMMTQEAIQNREKALEEELRRKYPVTVDDRALEQVRLPSGPALPIPPSHDGKAPDGHNHGPHDGHNH